MWQASVVKGDLAGAEWHLSRHIQGMRKMVGRYNFRLLRAEHNLIHLMCVRGRSHEDIIKQYNPWSLKVREMVEPYRASYLGKLEDLRSKHTYL